MREIARKAGDPSLHMLLGEPLSTGRPYLALAGRPHIRAWCPGSLPARPPFAGLPCGRAPPGRSPTYRPWFPEGRRIEKGAGSLGVAADQQPRVLGLPVLQRGLLKLGQARLQPWGKPLHVPNRIDCIALRQGQETGEDTQLRGILYLQRNPLLSMTAILMKLLFACPVDLLDEHPGFDDDRPQQGVDLQPMPGLLVGDFGNLAL